MKVLTLTWMLALSTLLTGCQNLIQLGASPIPVTAYTDGKQP